MFKRKRVMVLLLLMIAVVAGGWYWYVQQYSYASTNNAFVDADRATISSKLLDRIVKLYVDENDTVKQGDTLARLDDADFLAQRAKAEATVRSLTRSLDITTVTLDKARDDFNRAQKQFAGQIITQEQFNHAESALKLSPRRSRTWRRRRSPRRRPIFW